MKKLQILDEERLALTKNDHAEFTPNWQEKLNPVGKVVHSSLRPPTMEQQLERILLQRRYAQQQLAETESPAEALDFDVEDEDQMDPWSPHEIHEDEIYQMQAEEPIPPSNHPPETTDDTEPEPDNQPENGG